MLDIIEYVRNEFKVKLTDKFEEEVISFLNTNGGNIYLGVNDKGDIVGINGNIDLRMLTSVYCFNVDETINKYKETFKNNVYIK